LKINVSENNCDGDILEGLLKVIKKMNKLVELSV